MSRMQRSSWAARVLARRRKNLARASAGHRRRLSIEPLEDRRLLTVLTVNSDKDYTSPGDGRVTLREAVVAANTDTMTDLGQRGNGADTIIFASSLSGHTILLDGTEIQITAALTIDASSLAGGLTIDAGGQSRIFNITAGTGDFAFQALNLTGGATSGANSSSSTTYSGGAIRSLTTGLLTVEDSTLSGNHTQGRYAKGGAVFALGGVEVIGSTVDANYTSGDYASGGGLFSGGSVTLTDSIVSNNYTQGDDASGGGVYAALGAELNNTEVSGNHTAGESACGGGLYSGGEITLTDAIVIGNYTLEDYASGGGSYAVGNATLTDSTVGGNYTEGGSAAGGGAWVDGSVTATGSTFADNHTLGDYAHGGALYADGATTFVGSTATGNYTHGAFARGGAMYGNNYVLLTALYDNDDIVIAATLVSDNHTEGATAFGGAVFASSAATLHDATLSGNYTLGSSARGGALWAGGNVAVDRSTLSSNFTRGDNSYGGAVQALNDVALTDSTVSGNHTEGVSATGGAINAAATLTVTQSTVSGNYTQGNYADAAGVKSEGRTVILYSTVANNHAYHPSAVGGGVWNGGGPLFVIGSIVADNVAVGGSPDLRPGSGTLTVNHSLIGNNAGTSLVETHTPDLNGNLIGGATIIDPLLGPLADNGGRTETHALLPGSPAIDRGDPTLIAGVGDVSLYDQRGPFCRRIVNGGLGSWMDVGAFEFGNLAPGSIQGQKWNDQDGNHVKNGDESGLAGWTIYLDLNQNGTLDSGTGIAVLEPDDYTLGEVLNDIQPGVSLSVVGGTSSNVLAGIPAGGYASTGTLAFVTSSQSWVQSGPRLRVDFDWLVNRVSIDAIATDSQDVGSLEAYDANANLLATYHTSVLGLGEAETMEIIRGTPDIAFVIASGLGSDTVNLDNLRYSDSEPVMQTDASGNYSFPLLEPGTYVVAEVQQPGWTQTFPESPGTHTVTVDPDEDETGVNFGNRNSSPLQALPGDYNLDGAVDAADYSVWRDTEGSTSDLRADGTGPAGVPDGVVNSLDFDFWKANFGRTAGSGASLALAVAEASAEASATVEAPPAAPDVAQSGLLAGSAEPDVSPSPVARVPLGLLGGTTLAELPSTVSDRSLPSAAMPSDGAQQDEALLAWLDALADTADQASAGAVPVPLADTWATDASTDVPQDAVDAVFDVLDARPLGLLL